MNIVFMVEEPSMKNVLDILLPRILPEGVFFRVIPHNGKSDLQSSIPKKLKGWNQPDTKFVIIQDQDGADCKILKQKLLDLCKGCDREVCIRIACRELEAWYLGDLDAVSQAYKKDFSKLKSKAKFRIPDDLANPKEELRKLIPMHQQIQGARLIAEHMNENANTSYSFNCFVSGVKKLCT